ncbi:uncharacterized protein KY384_002923 [Bacidia gigantensis]|uniref:uncharacterized protein n=1 Tax=Bacidia gigantensis TaxID=2732470 RepID=UPI001D04F9B0|nr:uncharacterized protein KY384_002923 [Bacidia gigantensis]KAG8531295.1 hypothetical protein KY384_002923 [Bacidia gigantensis]
MLECIPREKIWNPLITTGHCIDLKPTIIATGIFNIVSDFMILALPMVPIYKLQRPFKKKLRPIAVFAAGICACIVSIVRTYYSFVVLESLDNTYVMMLNGFWAWAEMTIGILIACLPIMPRFFDEISSQCSKTIDASFSSIRSKVLYRWSGSKMDVSNRRPPLEGHEELVAEKGSQASQSSHDTTPDLAYTPRLLTPPIPKISTGHSIAFNGRQKGQRTWDDDRDVTCYGLRGQWSEV